MLQSNISESFAKVETNVHAIVRLIKAAEIFHGGIALLPIPSCSGAFDDQQPSWNQQP